MRRMMVLSVSCASCRPRSSTRGTATMPSSAQRSSQCTLQALKTAGLDRQRRAKSAPVGSMEITTCSRSRTRAVKKSKALRKPDCARAAQVI